MKTSPAVETKPWPVATNIVWPPGLSGRSIRLLSMATRTPTRYTPRNRAELVACLIGLADGQIVELKPDAVELLRRRYRMRTVKDVIDLPAWPYGRLRIRIESRPMTEVVIERVERRRPDV